MVVARQLELDVSHFAGFVDGVDHVLLRLLHRTLASTERHKQAASGGTEWLVTGIESIQFGQQLSTAALLTVEPRN